jgi:hypothetical protein
MLSPTVCRFRSWVVFFTDGLDVFFVVISLHARTARTLVSTRRDDSRSRGRRPACLLLPMPTGSCGLHQFPGR